MSKISVAISSTLNLFNLAVCTFKTAVRFIKLSSVENIMKISFESIQRGMHHVANVIFAFD